MELRPGWIKEKRDSLAENITEVVYTYTTAGGLWQVIANQRGTVMKGTSPTLSEASQLDDFAFVLSDAMREHLKLKRHAVGKLLEIVPNIPGN